jgi:hypothetical protein
MKKTIPGALREQVWLLHCGDKHFKHKCLVTWCENIMTPFSFECGHNLPESKGGSVNDHFESKNESTSIFVPNNNRNVVTIFYAPLNSNGETVGMNINMRPGGGITWAW